MKSSLDFEELKKRTRILVVDDENSFPINLFEDEGYSIDKWDSVKDYGKLANGAYDIIVLDIQGVAKHISENDGLGVLESLKNNNPAQIVISYSQHSYDLSKIKFFQLADENIAKPSDYLKIKRVIDSLITDHFKPERYIKELNQILFANRINKREIRKLYLNMSKAIKNKTKPNWSSILNFVQDNSEVKRLIINLGNTILKFYI